MVVVKIEHSPLSRVPLQQRLSLLSVAIVHMGMLTALDQFMLGAVLGNAMALIDAFIAIFIGSLIFGIVTFGLGFAGMREGLSGSLLAPVVRFWTNRLRVDRSCYCRQFIRLVWHSECYFC